MMTMIYAVAFLFLFLWLFTFLSGITLCRPSILHSNDEENDRYDDKTHSSNTLPWNVRKKWGEATRRPKFVGFSPMPFRLYTCSSMFRVLHTLLKSNAVLSYIRLLRTTSTVVYPLLRSPTPKSTEYFTRTIPILFCSFSHADQENLLRTPPFHRPSSLCSLFSVHCSVRSS